MTDDNPTTYGLLEQMRKENRDDHGRIFEKLETVDGKVGRLHERVRTVELQQQAQVGQIATVRAQVWEHAAELKAQKDRRTGVRWVIGILVAIASALAGTLFGKVR